MYHPDLLRHPDACPALVLNADYTPLSYYPLSLWPWQTAIKAIFLERIFLIFPSVMAADNRLPVGFSDIMITAGFFALFALSRRWFFSHFKPVLNLPHTGH